MRLLRATVLAICAAFIFAAFCPATNADEWNKKTIVTVNEEVQIPGYILDPGVYVFKIANLQSTRNVVQIWTGDEQQLVTTLVTIPIYRGEDEVTDYPVFRLDERPSDQPMAIGAWFYPGDTLGIEFLYPSYQRVYTQPESDSDYSQ